MSHDRRSFAARFLYLYVGVVLLISFAACRQVPADKDITSVSTISGTVNDSAVEGKISATFNTGRGGSSTCEFSQLPLGFTPSAFGTHT